MKEKNYKKPLKILHCADLHFFRIKRHQEFRDLIYLLKQKVIDTNIDIIYIGGDVVDSKAKLSPEQIQLVSLFFIELSNLCPVIMIPGNHDVDLRRKGSLDSLSPIIENIKSKFPIHYLINSGIYELYDIQWVVWSCLDNKDPWKENKRKKGKYYIGCYHGTVIGAATDSGWSQLGSTTSIDLFKDTDLTFLADIHHQQFFRNNEIAYCGSWAQIAVDESEEKGGLIWEWSDKENKYIPQPFILDNQYGFKTYEITDIEKFDIKSIKINSTKKKIRLLYLGNELNYSSVGFYELRKNIKTLFPNEVILQKRFKKNKPVKEDKKTKEEKSLDFFREYFSSQGCDDEQIKLLRKIDSEFDKMTDVTDYQTGEYFIEEIEIHNFLCYGENNIIKFTDLQGLVGLLGANKMGKTSVLNALVFCLFNKSSASTVDKMINDQLDGKEKAFVQVKLSINGVLWRIKRTITPSKTGGTIKVEVYETIEEVEEPRHEESRPKTDAQVLRKLLGDEQTFLTTVLYTLKTPEFVNNKNAERLDLMMKFLGIVIYDQKLKLSDEEIKTKQVEYQHVLKLIEKIDLTELESILREKTNEIKTLNKKIIDLKVEEKNISFTITENEIKSNKLGAINIKKTEEELKSEETLLQSQITDKETQITTDKELRSKLITLWNTDERTKGLLDLWKTDHDKYSVEKEEVVILKNEINNLELQLKSEFCITCKQKWHKVDSSQIKKEIEEKQLIINSHNILIADWKSFQDTTSKNKKQITSYDSQIQLNESRLETLNNKMLLCKEQIKSWEDNKYKIEQKEKYANRITILKKDLSNKEKERYSIEAQVTIKEKEIIEAQKSIELYNDKIKEVTDKELYIRGLELYKKGMHRTGIPTLVLNTYIPDLNSEINGYVNDLFDFNIKFELIENSLDIVFYYDDLENKGKGKRDVERASGMEGTIINLAIRAALTKVSLLPKPSILMLDEIFSTLDSENLEKIKLFLIRLKEQYYNIVIISHLEEIKDLCEYNLSLKKENGISSIES